MCIWLYKHSPQQSSFSQQDQRKTLANKPVLICLIAFVMTLIHSSMKVSVHVEGEGGNIH